MPVAPFALMAGLSLSRIEPVFHTPLLSFRLADPAGLNRQILDEIAAIRAADPGVVRSNRGGWHSQCDLFQRPEPGLSQLCNHVRDAIFEATRQTAIEPEFGRLRLACEGWVNINPPGAFNAPHDHPGWFWSGCYYVAVPETPACAAADPTAGCLELIDSRTNLRVMSLVNAPFMASKLLIRPEPGLLLLFPSHVQHWVYPAAGSGDRVSAAFNARFERAA